MKKPFLILTALLFPLFLHAQIEYPGTPRSLQLKLKKAPAEIRLTGYSSRKAAAYVSSLSSRLKTMAFALPMDTLLSPARQGTWEILPDGSRLWRLALVSPDALSLNLLFSRFKLPPGAEVYIYTPDYQYIRGAFTSANHLKTGVLATAPLPGDRLVVELNIQANPDFEPELEISRISHDFKGIFGLTAANTSGECNVDINCPAGADWQTEKKAVVKFIRGGVWLCTGSLINNVRNNGRPLLLSANHTIGSESQAQQTVFFFRYERPNCGSGDGTLQYTLSGSTLLATTSKVDFSLVELSSAPPPEYEPFYAGWDRRIFTFLDTVTCIHHPQGSAKKISKSFHRVVTADFGGGYDTNTHWKISAWDLGTTEPGSSGSPLFNIDHRIVGDLTGGDASCSYNFNDYFQKFSVSWDKYPDSSSQLKYWLDPEETGVFVLNGFDPYAGGKPVANFSIRPLEIQVGRKVYFGDLSTGQPSSWQWTFENGSPAASTLQTPNPVKFNLPGTYHVTLHISNEQGTDSLRQTIIVSDYPGSSLTENRIVPKRITKISDISTGQPVSVSWNITGSSSPLFSGPFMELSFENQGEYTVYQIVDYSEFSDTLIHYNQIRVIPEVLAYRSHTYSNIEPDEHRGVMRMGGQGYIPGSNSQGITGYAEAFRRPSDTTCIINGITVPIEIRSAWNPNYYLPVVIWNAKKQVIMRDSLRITDYEPESRVTKWLRSPVNFDTLIYIGFEVRPWEQGTFVSNMATDRGEIGGNTAWVIKGGQWQPLTEVAGIHTSFGIAIETSVLMNSYKGEIKILPNFNDGNFTIDMGTLVFNKVDLTIYNVKGQQVIADISKTENQINFQVLPPVPGIYVVRLIIDNFQFATKLMIIRH